MNLSTNVQFLLEAQIQFKILHWQTKGYARHIAFGDIYDSLGELVDEYVEAEEVSFLYKKNKGNKCARRNFLARYLPFW